MLDILAHPSAINVIMAIAAALVLALALFTNDPVDALVTVSVLAITAAGGHSIAEAAVEKRDAAEAVTDETTAPFLTDYRECHEDFYGDTKTECKARIIENVEDLEGGDTAEAVKDAITAYETRLEQ